MWRDQAERHRPQKRTPTDIMPVRADTISRWRANREFVRVGRGVLVPKDAATDGLSQVTRTRAYFLINPRSVATHFSALALAGLSMWINEQPTSFLTIGTTEIRYFLSDATVPANKLILRRRSMNTRRLSTHSPDASSPDLYALTPMAACASVIDALEHNRPSVDPWFTPLVPGLTDIEVQQVQVMDAVRRFLSPHATEEVAFAEALGVVNQKVFKKVWTLSSSLADSPPETALRLLSRSRCGSRFEVFPQVEILCGGVRVTVMDLLIVEVGSALWAYAREKYSLELAQVGELLRSSRHVGLQYDGQHHLNRAQRDFDTRSNLTCDSYGLVVQRISIEVLRSLPLFDEVLHRKLFGPQELP
ncbi:hypothetical protein GC425_09645 [Corynebacterium sp. zg254]|uniref:Uncharacterized protein n=1 Tax=Corynebacterium zhongnanshanii TaxID=2768834 RepID=A0ABQ6VBZ2_9CORY|nr:MULTISPECIES: hypothetical protein [Corynebacterium]KAB3519250.1 hypothetical protein F8377_09700 [Corynebacterium zhongnanshanii]MCR5915101.1 hypothetical protein [Corynebacterium sp. zg254]